MTHVNPGQLLGALCVNSLNIFRRQIRQVGDRQSLLDARALRGRSDRSGVSYAIYGEGMSR